MKYLLECVLSPLHHLYNDSLALLQNISIHDSVDSSLDILHNPMQEYNSPVRIEHDDPGKLNAKPWNNTAHFRRTTNHKLVHIIYTTTNTSIKNSLMPRKHGE
jgi:hypothetical protein